MGESYVETFFANQEITLVMLPLAKGSWEDTRPPLYCLVGELAFKVT